MRKIFTFSAVLILLVFASTWVSAQVLETETFNYVLGDTLNGFNGWLGHSGVGTNPEKDTVGLTYAGYIGSGIGGASTLTTTGEDINKVWASYPNGVTSGTIYYSLLVELDSAQTSADYFFHLFKNSTTFSARLYAKKAFTRDSISFGILKGSTFANVAWSDSVYKRGTPYLIVVKYTFVPGSANDTVSMWINPNISGTEPTPTVFETTADKSTTDDDTVYGVAIRQGSATQAPRGRVGAIRAVQSWKNINNKYAVLSKNSINFSNITLGTVVKDSVIITDNDMTSINVSSVTSGNSVFVVSPTSATIAVGSSQKFYVTYTPTATVTTSSAIVFNSDGASSPDSVYVTGNAIVPGFGISTKSYNFGQLYLDSTLVDSVTVTNLLASSTLNITSVTSSNPFFTVGPTSGSLAVGASMKFGVKFMPTAAGVTTSSIVFFNNGGLVSDTLKVAGNGLLKAPLISATPILKDYHGVWVGHAWKDSVTVKNTGYDSLKITGVTSSDPTFVVTPTTAQLDTQATKKFYITFTPTALGAKSASIVFLSNDTTHAKDTVMAIGTGVTYSTIANAREDLNGDLIPDHSVTGDTLIIAGVITSKNLQSVGGQTAIYIQDSTAGVEIFGYALPPVTMVIGDSVFAIGVVEQYHGLTEFYPLEPSYDVLDTLHFGILKHNATVPKPKHLTYHQYVANSESYEGLLVEIDTLYKKSGTWPGVSTSASIYLTTLGGTDSTEMYISSSTDIA
ncbi:MAG: choice-of-anchor D domain-containing protein, partial [Bacteroidota bacterium]